MATNSTRTSTCVGTSGGTIKTAPEPIHDVTNKIRCILIGAGITRETFVYVRPGNLQRRIYDYAQLGQSLICPKKDMAAEIKRIGKLRDDGTLPPPVPVNGVPTAPCFVLKSGAQPLICLNDGRFFLSAQEAGKRYNLTGASVLYLIHNSKKSLTGRSFRYASDEEIEQARMTPGWKAPVAEL